MKNKFLTVLIGLASILYLSASAARAQSPTYTFPQDVASILAPTGTACNGAAQNYPVQNLGQTQHYAYLTGIGVQTLTMQIFGIDAAGNSYLISDTATIPNVRFTGGSVLGFPVLQASGYFPSVKVTVTCSPATATYELSYTGTSAAASVPVGGYQLAQVDKIIAAAAPAATGIPVVFMQAPFGSSLGTITFAYGATGTYPTGSTVSVQCNGSATASPTLVFGPLTAASGAQQFIVPDLGCPTIGVTYTSGGAGTATASLEYIFPQPGLKLANSYMHVPSSSQLATVIKAGPGTLAALVIGTPAAGTVTLFDLAPAACTGTPATNIVSVLTGVSAIAYGAQQFNGALFLNGICAKSSAAIDYTAVYQ